MKGYYFSKVVDEDESDKYLQLLHKKGHKKMENLRASFKIKKNSLGNNEPEEKIEIIIDKNKTNNK